MKGLLSPPPLARRTGGGTSTHLLLLSMVMITLITTRTTSAWNMAGHGLNNNQKKMLPIKSRAVSSLETASGIKTTMPVLTTSTSSADTATKRSLPSPTTDAFIGTKKNQKKEDVPQGMIHSKKMVTTTPNHPVLPPSKTAVTPSSSSSLVPSQSLLSTVFLDETTSKNYDDEYWYHPQIHTLGNAGIFGAIHAALAPLSTYIIDTVAYNGVDIRMKVRTLLNVKCMCAVMEMQ
jgi:hypothetical protein